MKIYRFDPEVGKSLDLYNSSGSVISQVAHLLDEAVIIIEGMNFDPAKRMPPV